MDKISKQSATTAILLDQRFPKRDGTYPVKLRITYNRKQKYYSTRYIPKPIGGILSDNQKYWTERLKRTISLTETEFEKVRFKCRESKKSKIS